MKEFHPKKKKQGRVKRNMCCRIARGLGLVWIERNGEERKRKKNEKSDDFSFQKLIEIKGKCTINIKRN